MMNAQTEETKKKNNSKKKAQNLLPKKWRTKWALFNSRCIVKGKNSTP